MRVNCQADDVLCKQAIVNIKVLCVYRFIEVWEWAMKVWEVQFVNVGNERCRVAWCCGVVTVCLKLYALRASK